MGLVSSTFYYFVTQDQTWQELPGSHGQTCVSVGRDELAAFDVQVTTRLRQRSVVEVFVETNDNALHLQNRKDLFETISTSPI